MLIEKINNIIKSWRLFKLNINEAIQKVPQENLETFKTVGGTVLGLVLAILLSLWIWLAMFVSELFIMIPLLLLFIGIFLGIICAMGYSIFSGIVDSMREDK